MPEIRIPTGVQRRSGFRAKNIDQKRSRSGTRRRIVQTQIRTEQVSKRGASSIGYQIVRLNGDVAAIFEDWILQYSISEWVMGRT